MQQIVAGDVLDHLAAGLEGLAAAADARESRGNDRAPRPALMRRGPARLQASTPPRVGAPSLAAEQRAPDPAARRPASGRALSSAASISAQRRRRARGQHQLLRLVVADAGKRREVERVRRLQRPPEAALAAAADDLERLLARHRRRDDRRRASRSSLGRKRVMRFARSEPRQIGERAAWPRWTCRRPSSAQRCSCGEHLAGIEQAVRDRRRI